MLRVDYRSDEISLDRKFRVFLEARNFDFALSESKTYCSEFYHQLKENYKKTLIRYLCEFANAPFIKAKTVKPELLTRVFSTEDVYLYWVTDEPR